MNARYNRVYSYAVWPTQMIRLGPTGAVLWRYTRCANGHSIEQHSSCLPRSPAAHAQPRNLICRTRNGSIVRTCQRWRVFDARRQCQRKTPLRRAMRYRSRFKRRTESTPDEWILRLSGGTISLNSIRATSNLSIRQASSFHRDHMSKSSLIVRPGLRRSNFLRVGESRAGQRANFVTSNIETQISEDMVLRHVRRP